MPAAIRGGYSMSKDTKTKPNTKLKRALKGRPRQYAAIPIRVSRSGKPKVLLLTSRRTKRWIIPKGWPIEKLGPAGTARREAFEEAGLTGRIVRDLPIGRYRYRKGDWTEIGTITVKVFLMEVKRQLEKWPEHRQRKTRWFKPRRAALLVNEPELARLLERIHKIAGRLGR